MRPLLWPIFLKRATGLEPELATEEEVRALAGLYG
jgi:hypothetical protein